MICRHCICLSTCDLPMSSFQNMEHCTGQHRHFVYASVSRLAAIFNIYHIYPNHNCIVPSTLEPITTLYLRTISYNYHTMPSLPYVSLPYHILPYHMLPYFLCAISYPAIHSFRIFLQCLFKSTTTPVLRGAPDYSICTVSELTCWSATDTVTMNEGLAQSPYAAARVGFKPATLRM